MPTYKIKDIPGFENLLVVGQFRQFGGTGEAWRILEVEQFINTNVIVGDRELKIAIPPQSMWLAPVNLELVSDTEGKRVYANDNPFGTFKYEGRYEKDKLVIAYGMYEKAVSITIYEMQPATPNLAAGHSQKTLYSSSFFSNRTFAMEMVEEMLHGNLDPDDLIFELEKLKGNDYHG